MRPILDIRLEAHIDNKGGIWMANREVSVLLQDRLRGVYPYGDVTEGQLFRVIILPADKPKEPAS